MVIGRQRQDSQLSIPSLGLLVAMVLPAPAFAGTLSGTASYQERIALPPDAVFEALLIDTARADAPAPVLGRARLQPAGQPPFRFSIPYRDGDLTPRGRYAVRATVRSGELTVRSTQGGRNIATPATATTSATMDAFRDRCSVESDMAPPGLCAGTRPAV
jgi:uncharacterized lipoprotein YbaY